MNMPWCVMNKVVVHVLECYWNSMLNGSLPDQSIVMAFTRNTGDQICNYKPFSASRAPHEDIFLVRSVTSHGNSWHNYSGLFIYYFFYISVTLTGHKQPLILSRMSVDGSLSLQWKELCNVSRNFYYLTNGLWDERMQIYCVNLK